MSLQITDLPEDARTTLAFLRGHLSGVIRFDGEFIDLKVVIAPDGRLVAPVMVAMLTSVDCALFLPREPKDEFDDAIQIQIELEKFDEAGPDGGLADRWKIYHGEPPDVNWATFAIDAARLKDVFVSGDAFEIPNGLHGYEAAICREINAGDLEALRRLASACCDHELDEARLVGIDELGFDVRGRFDVVRVTAPELMLDGDAARATLAALLEAHR